MWGIYLLLVPFYVFKSGLPQPGDMFIVLVAPFALRGWNGRLSRIALSSLRPLIWFTVWVCLVDFVWAMVLGNFELFGTDTFILYPIYYLYNSLLFLVAVVLYERFGDRFLRLTLRMILVTIFLQVAASLVLRGPTRGSGFFNNPNQLGYYALLAACMIVLLHWRLRGRLLTSSLALISCGYLSMISASRAAMAGILLLFALLMFSNPRMLVAAALVAVALLFVGGPVADAFDSSQDRVRNRSSQVGFLAERGYDRIWEHKEHLILGAGEGGLSRFAERGFHMEIHSSAGTIIFSYGIIGASLFVLFMTRLIQGASARVSLVLVPPLLYALAHQGLRFTLFWILLAVFVALKHDMQVAFTARSPGAASRPPVRKS